LPTRPWQRFCDSRHGAADRKRRQTEKDRQDRGRRKFVNRRSSKVPELTKAEKSLLSQLRQYPDMRIMVDQLLEGPPRNRSPEDGRPGIKSMPKRMRDMRRVHPRSLEKTE
jgi:hypothetical protein